MDNELYKNLKKQIEDNWLNPEIEKRNFTELIYAILIVFKPGNPAEVLLNGETNLIVEMQLPNSSAINSGKITFEDFSQSQIKSINVSEDIFYNYGYIAALVINDNWLIRFDFIPHKKELKEKMEMAEEYVKAAEAVSHEKVKIYNLFQAIEQATQSVLYMNAHHKAILQKARKHNATKALVNQELKMGNMPENVVSLFNKLLDERPKSYSQDTLNITLTEDNILVIKNFIQSYKELFTY